MRRLPQLARVLGVEAGQFFPATGYAPAWPHNVHEDGTHFRLGPDPKVLENIEGHLAAALGEFRKLTRNQQEQARA